MGVDFRWQHGEERSWLVRPVERRSRRLRRIVVSGAGLLVVLLLGAGAFLWNRSRVGLGAARADLQAVVDAEVAALQSGDEEVYLSLQDFNDQQWSRHQQLVWDALERSGEEVGPRTIVNLDLRQEHAWVEVEYLVDGVSHRRMLFYRLYDGVWRRASPNLEYLGVRAEKETDNLRYVFHEREEKIVDLISEEMETVHARLVDDLGLSEQQQSLVFEFRPSAEAQPALYSEAHFFVPSPLLLGVRADGKPDRDLVENLTQSMGLYLAIARASLHQQEQAGGTAEQGPISIAEGQPAGSWVMLRGIVAWAVDRAMQRPTLPEEWQDWLQDAVAANDQMPLTSLWPPHQFATDRDVGLAIAQAQSVVNYAVELRGPDVVPSLLDALGSHLSAAESIVAATDMDLDAFEAGWMEYMRQSFGP